MSFKNRYFILIAFAILSALSSLYNPANAQQKPLPYADEIKAFQVKDDLSAPPKNGIVFIGSSSVRKWTDFETRFPNPKLIRRGIGGSTLEQFVDFYLPFVVFPYQPAKVFVYVGENDIATGATADQLMENYKKLTALIKAKLPKAQLYFLSVKYSPSRAKFSHVVTQTNKLLQAFTKTQKNLHYINIANCLLISDEHSDPSLFETDLLHLNTKGYDRWDKVLRPYFMAQ